MFQTVGVLLEFWAFVEFLHGRVAPINKQSLVMAVQLSCEKHNMITLTDMTTDEIPFPATNFFKNYDTQVTSVPTWAKGLNHSAADVEFLSGELTYSC